MRKMVLYAIQSKEARRTLSQFLKSLWRPDSFIFKNFFLPKQEKAPFAIDVGLIR